MRFTLSNSFGPFNSVVDSKRTNQIDHVRHLLLGHAGGRFPKEHHAPIDTGNHSLSSDRSGEDPFPVIDGELVAMPFHLISDVPEHGPHHRVLTQTPSVLLDDLGDSGFKFLFHVPPVETLPVLGFHSRCFREPHG